MTIGLQFSSFLLVGATGFLVDGGLLFALTTGASLSPLPARLVSFSIAVTVTWVLNRLFTFRQHASKQRFAEWRRYVLVNGFGGLINLGIFALLAGPVPGLGVNPLIAFAIASGVALMFNFLGSRALAFRSDTGQVARQEGAPPF